MASILRLLDSEDVSMLLASPVPAAVCAAAKEQIMALHALQSLISLLASSSALCQQQSAHELLGPQVADAMASAGKLVQELHIHSEQQQLR